MTKYRIPENWGETCNGQGCDCMASYEGDCSCGADWTSDDVYRLRIQVNALINQAEGPVYIIMSEDWNGLTYIKTAMCHAGTRKEAQKIAIQMQAGYDKVDTSYYVEEVERCKE